MHGPNITIDLKPAKALGLTIPQTLLLRAEPAAYFILIAGLLLLWRRGRAARSNRYRVRL
jgi:hypothetical protein